MIRELKNRASKTLALGLEEARIAASLTKADLAEKANCSAGHVTDIEKRNKNPRQALISRLAEALGRSPADLYELGEQKLDEETLEQARQTRQRMEALRTRKVVLEVLPDLDAGDLRAVMSAASKLLDLPAE